MDIMSVLGTVGVGGVTGLIGTAITTVMSYKTKALDYKHELDMEVAARETMKEEWAQRVKVAETEGATKVEVAELEAFGESIRADKATYSTGLNIGRTGTILMVIIDFLRGIIRPLSTILFIGMTFIMYFSLKGKVYSIDADPKELMSLFNQVANMILYLTSTTLCWWFGIRMISSKMAK